MSHARTHARSLCVHPNFQATTRATSDEQPLHRYEKQECLLLGTPFLARKSTKITRKGCYFQSNNVMTNVSDRFTYKKAEKTSETSQRMVETSK